MRILLAGDTHGNTTHVRYLIDVAVDQGCDRIFQLGDFGAWEHMSDGRQFMDKVANYARKNAILVYFLDGNHDKTSLLLEKYGNSPDHEGFLRVRNWIFYSPRGHRWVWDEVSFISLGGAYSVDKDYRIKVLEAQGSGKPERYWFPEEEMTDEDLARIILDNPGPVDVMLAHDKPRCSNPPWNRKDIPECWPNQDRLQMAVSLMTPAHFYHGHLHFLYAQDVDYGDLAGERRSLHVRGLAPDPSGGYPGYILPYSWHVFDTDDFKIDQIAKGGRYPWA
jgi:Calcineurin-like phosphoesterase